jgi:hypothetical protein
VRPFPFAAVSKARRLASPREGPQSRSIHQSRVRPSPKRLPCALCTQAFGHRPYSDAREMKAIVVVDVRQRQVTALESVFHRRCTCDSGRIAAPQRIDAKGHKLTW